MNIDSCLIKLINDLCNEHIGKLPITMTNDNTGMTNGGEMDTHKHDDMHDESCPVCDMIDCANDTCEETIEKAEYMAQYWSDF
jgi:hypothetical protein